MPGCRGSERCARCITARSTAASRSSPPSRGAAAAQSAAAHSRRSDTTSASSSPWARASAHAATRGWPHACATSGAAAGSRASPASARANRARVVARWEGTSAWGSPAEAPHASRGAVLPRRTSVTQRAHTVPTPRALYTQRCPWARVTWSAGSIAPKGADSDRQARGAARGEQRLEREGYTVHRRVSFGAARSSANLPA